MHVYRETVSLQQAVTTETDTQIQGLIAKRLQDLADYEEPLSELVHILVIEPSDALTEVDAELGFSLSARPWDLLETHPGWHEITVVVSDDGWGWVIYVPNDWPNIAAISTRCATTQDSGSP